MAATELELAQRIVNKLRQYGAYVYHEATTGSVYVKFPHWGLGSVRIGDHRGRSIYRYRWEIRTDLTHHHKSYKDQGVMRECFSPDYLGLFYQNFLASATVRKIKPGDKQTWAEYCNR